jgi:hypothetical protein
MADAVTAIAEREVDPAFDPGIVEWSLDVMHIRAAK